MVHLVDRRPDCSPLLRRAGRRPGMPDAAVPTVRGVVGRRRPRRARDASTARRRRARGSSARGGHDHQPRARSRRSAGCARACRASRVMPRFSVKPDARTRVWLVYDLDPATGRAAPDRDADRPGGSGRARRLWAGPADVRFDDTDPRPPLPGEPLATARGGLGPRLHGRQHLAVQPRMGARPGVCRPWPWRSSAHRERAATMLRRLAADFVTADGATLDSSEVRGRDDVELDQNGMLLVRPRASTSRGPATRARDASSGIASSQSPSIRCAPSSATNRAAC